MWRRQVLGTVVFLLLTVALVLFLARNRGSHEGPVPDSASPERVERAKAPAPPSAEGRDPEPPAAETQAQAPRVPAAAFATTKVSFETDEAWELLEDARFTLHVEGVGASTVLDLLTAPYECTWKVQGDTIWIVLPGEEPPEPAR